MTPLEKRLLRDEIRALVSEEMKQYRHELDADVTRTDSERRLEQRSFEQAVAKRDQQIVEVLRAHGDHIAAKTATSIVPTAQGAERAALRAEWKTEAIAVDTDALAKGQRKALAWWRHPALPIIVYAVLDYIGAHWKGWIDVLTQ